MAEIEGATYALSALERKRAEIVRGIEEAEHHVEGLRVELSQLDAVMALFREPQAASLPPTLGRAASGYFGRGELSRLALSTLRLNPGAKPIEIATVIMRQRGIAETDRVARYLVRKAVGRVMRKAKGGMLRGGADAVVPGAN